MLKHLTYFLCRYTIDTNVDPVTQLQVGEYFYPPRDGCLYASIPIPNVWINNSKTRRLFARSSTKTALMAVNNNQVAVHEIEHLKDCWTDDNFHISIVKEASSEIERAGKPAPIQIQFQLDRIPLCKMHSAIDKLAMRTIEQFLMPSEYPTIVAAKHPHPHLNSSQQQILDYVSGSKQVQSPPLLVIGPFGTGKTTTLAHAALDVLQQPDTKVLIATHSNRYAIKLEYICIYIILIV